MINADKPHWWADDVQESVALYNGWFLDAAPEAYRNARQHVVDDVENLFVRTNEMRDITPAIIRQNPGILATLRMATAPPIARDRLSGLAGIPGSLVKTLEEGALPPRARPATLQDALERICDVIETLLDRDLFDWLGTGMNPDPRQRELAAVVVSDRRCGAVADPIVRNAQEARQLAVMADWLMARGYREQRHPSGVPLAQMEPGTYSFRQNVPCYDENGDRINMPIDAVIQPRDAQLGDFPMLVEAKSAGDFANTNKRRKEEATKIRQLRATHGDGVRLVLFLCGYFNTVYLQYEAAEGLDWVWEHRPDDFELGGL